MKKNHLQILFLALALILLIFEILIGLFIRDSFVRPYLGDTLEVILIWCVLRIFFPTGKPWLSAAVFLFALLVEVFQIFPLCNVLGIENWLLRTLMGMLFAWGDIIAYFAGYFITGIVDLGHMSKKRKPGFESGN